MALKFENKDDIFSKRTLGALMHSRPAWYREDIDPNNKRVITLKSKKRRAFVKCESKIIWVNHWRNTSEYATSWIHINAFFLLTWNTLRFLNTSIGKQMCCISDHRPTNRLKNDHRSDTSILRVPCYQDILENLTWSGKNLVVAGKLETIFTN